MAGGAKSHRWTRAAVLAGMGVLGAIGRLEAQTPEWIARYNGPPGTSGDVPQDIVVDSLGNVYVTGYSTDSNDDYATAKYNSNGVLQWAARYNGTQASADQAYAVGVDAAGNVYVVGRADNASTRFDYVTVKYASNGSQAWAMPYSVSTSTGTASGDFGRDIEVTAGGTVYVTGSSGVAANNHCDYATIRYDTNGGQQWVNRYNGVGATFNDQAWAIAVDSAGNAYVTGQSREGGNTFDDFATVKYRASDGAELWADRYAGPGSQNDVALAITVDAASNVYVTGYSYGGSTQNDYFTIKFDTNGNRQWTDRFNGIGGGPDEAYAIAVDADGNVYVTGSSAGGGGRDYATVKYNASGSRVWVVLYDGPGNNSDYGQDIGVDQVGNVFVTGYAYGGNAVGDDFATVKYNVNGTQLWVAAYNGPGTTTDRGSDLAVDANGTVYVTGQSHGGGGSGAGNNTSLDYATIKYFECTSILPDCNGNGQSDTCDISGGESQDCNTNAIPDECDVDGMTSGDCDQDGVPDECQGAAGIVQWTGSDGGAWTGAGNWNGGSVPAGGAFALLYNDTAVDNRCLLAAAGTRGVCSLTVSALGPGRQILDIAEGSTLLSTGGADLGSGGDIAMTGGELAGGTIAVTGGVLRGYGRVSADVDNEGTVRGSAGKTLVLDTATVTNQTTGVIEAPAGAVLLADTPTIDQTGEIEVRAQAGLYCANPLVNQSGGTVRLLDGVISADGFTNEAGANFIGFGSLDGSTANDGNIVTIANTNFLGDLENNGTMIIQNGILTITGTLTGNGTILGAFGTRDGEFGGLAVYGAYRPDSTATQTIAGGLVKVGGAFDVAIDDSARFDLTTSVLQMSGLPTDGVQTLEAMADDAGCSGITLPDASLYSVNTLRIGPTLVMVQIVDAHDNTAGAGAEAVYVKSLIMHPGTILDLAGHSLYYEAVSPANPQQPGSGVQIVDTVGGASFCQLAPPARGDFLGDGLIDLGDLAIFVQVLLGADANSVHATLADMNGDGTTDGRDIAGFVTAITAR